MNKTPGQVGYEAMLDIMQRRDGLPPHEPWDDSEESKQAADCLNGVWSEQHESLRDDWERVAARVLEDARAEIERLKVELQTVLTDRYRLAKAAQRYRADARNYADLDKELDTLGV